MLEPHLNYSRRFLKMTEFKKYEVDARRDTSSVIYNINFVVNVDEVVAERISYSVFDFISNVGGTVSPLKLFFGILAQSVSSLAQMVSNINALLSVKLKGKGTAIKLSLA